MTPIFRPIWLPVLLTPVLWIGSLQAQTGAEPKKENKKQESLKDRLSTKEQSADRVSATTASAAEAASPPQTLPRTAGNAPLIGLFGFGSLAIFGALRGWRARSVRKAVLSSVVLPGLLLGSPQTQPSSDTKPEKKKGDEKLGDRLSTKDTSSSSSTSSDDHQSTTTSSKKHKNKKTKTKTEGTTSTQPD